MDKKLLNSLGINTDRDIDAMNLFNESFANRTGANVSKESRQVLKNLKKFMQLYFSEIHDSLAMPISDDLSAAMYAAPHFIGETREKVAVICLDTANRPIAYKDIFFGSEIACPLDIRIILTEAILMGSSSIILVHNHPSDNIYPSAPDVSRTEDLRKACQACEINLVDHIILGKTRYYSFSTEKESELKFDI